MAGPCRIMIVAPPPPPPLPMEARFRVRPLFWQSGGKSYHNERSIATQQTGPN